jgi:uncharacterized cupin superfamily protein
VDASTLAAGASWLRLAAKEGCRRPAGASLYALPPGEATFPYHYELGNDELLVVIVGSPTLRSPDGERVLKPGDCIHFPGAHQVINRSQEEARVLLVSNFAVPRAAVQADSRKMMIRVTLSFSGSISPHGRKAEPVIARQFEQ